MPLSRRRFLAGTAVAALAAPSRVSSAAEPLRAAVIGHTGRGDFGHGLELIFSGRPGVELVGLADPDEAGRRRATERARAPRSYADYREMLVRERPQLVSLAMRHADQHRDVARACLEAGAHLYIEKPFARSMAETDELLKLAGARGLTVAVAHTMRMAPSVVRLRDAVRGGLIGDVREVRTFGKQDNRAGGEDMIVLGTHLFDLCRLFLGDPEWVSGRVLVSGRPATRADRRRVKDEVGWVAGDQVFATFGFRGGVHATFTSDARLRETTGHWGMELHGTKGVARILCDLNPAVLVREPSAWAASGRTDVWRAWASDAERPQTAHNDGPVDDWLTALREKREPECSGRNGAWAVEMAAGVIASSMAGRQLPFPLVDRGHPLGDDT